MIVFMRCELVNVQCFDLAFLCTCEKVALSSFSNVRPTHMPSNEDAPSFLMLWGHDDYTSLSFFFPRFLSRWLYQASAGLHHLSLSLYRHTRCAEQNGIEIADAAPSFFCLFGVCWSTRVGSIRQHTHTHTHVCRTPLFFG